DMFFYAEAMLFGQASRDLQMARGAIQALSVPLLAVAAVRSAYWQTRVALSRQVVLGSTTLIASGLYLSLTAAAGYFLREVGGTRGLVVEVVFFVGAIAVLAVILASGAYWGHARSFVDRHFFRHKYDWRREWLRSMQTISSGALGGSLEERCIKALADTVDSPGGAMWMFDGTRCDPVRSWNFAMPEIDGETLGAFARWLAEAPKVVDLHAVDTGKPDAAESGTVTRDEPVVAAARAFMASSRAWLAVPLIHRSMIGFVVLARARAPRTLDWEDCDLLDVVGRQAASYLAEQMATEALEAAREFEIFNRRFVFVIHDVKNLVSQLSVLASNVEKHGDRQDFRDDMVATLHDAAAKMRRLMERIHAFEPSPTEPGAGRRGRADAGQPLAPLVRRVLKANAPPELALIMPEDGGIRVVGDRDRLEAVIGHLVRNAIEAENGAGTARVEVSRKGRFVTIEIIDHGPGMDQDFIRRELFKPFQSTKRGGMGIGVYQCREYARELGGNLEALSQPGRGTTMRITLPLAEAGHGDGEGGASS
ncbi:MAG: PEP-CTERM system histidine kinase PrsK, partial [Alphaproteobacteria bacterium]